METKEFGILLAHLETQSILLDQIKNAKKEDTQLVKKINEIKDGKMIEFWVDFGDC